MGGLTKTVRIMPSPSIVEMAMMAESGIALVMDSPELVEELEDAWGTITTCRAERPLIGEE
jgi:hypothetical protein